MNKSRKVHQKYPVCSIYNKMNNVPYINISNSNNSREKSISSSFYVIENRQNLNICNTINGKRDLFLSDSLYQFPYSSNNTTKNKNKDNNINSSELECFKISYINNIKSFNSSAFYNKNNTTISNKYLYTSKNIYGKLLADFSFNSNNNNNNNNYFYHHKKKSTLNNVNINDVTPRKKRTDDFNEKTPSKNNKLIRSEKKKNKMKLEGLIGRRKKKIVANIKPKKGKNLKGIFDKLRNCDKNNIEVSTSDHQINTDKKIFDNLLKENFTDKNESILMNKINNNYEFKCLNFNNKTLNKMNSKKLEEDKNQQLIIRTNDQTTQKKESKIKSSKRKSLSMNDNVFDDIPNSFTIENIINKKSSANDNNKKQMSGKNKKETKKSIDIDKKTNVINPWEMSKNLDPNDLLKSSKHKPTIFTKNSISNNFKSSKNNSNKIKNKNKNKNINNNIYNNVNILKEKNKKKLILVNKNEKLNISVNINNNSNKKKRILSFSQQRLKNLSVFINKEKGKDKIINIKNSNTQSTHQNKAPLRKYITNENPFKDNDDFFNLFNNNNNNNNKLFSPKNSINENTNTLKSLKNKKNIKTNVKKHKKVISALLPQSINNKAINSKKYSIEILFNTIDTLRNESSPLGKRCKTISEGKNSDIKDKLKFKKNEKFSNISIYENEEEQYYKKKKKMNLDFDKKIYNIKTEKNEYKKFD